MPGLLQTEDYARAIFRTRFRITSDEIDERVAARLKRQEILTRDEPAALWVILDEWVLRRPVGGRHVMLEQVNRLIEAARQPHVVIEVIPASVGAHDGHGRCVRHCGLRGRAERRLPGRRGRWAARRGARKDVASLDLTWDTLRGETLPRAASLVVLEEAAKSWTSAT